jgi:Leucine-rich repeat (LRR) protein
MAESLLDESHVKEDSALKILRSEASTYHSMPESETGLQEGARRIRRALKSGATKLDLQLLGLKRLPKTLEQLTNFESLDLTGNNLTSSSLSPLVKLIKPQQLILNKNPLGELPRVICNLSTLQELRLEHCHLTQLPESIATCSHGHSGSYSGASFPKAPAFKKLPGMKRTSGDFRVDVE